MEIRFETKAESQARRDKEARERTPNETFEKRKKEYLQKINCRSEKYKYWTECF